MEVLHVENMKSDDIGLIVRVWLVKRDGYHFIGVGSMIWSRIVL